MKRDEIIALLKKHGATVPENATDKELLDLLNQQLEKPKSAKVEDPAPEPQPEPAPAPSDDLKSEIENLKQEVKALKNRPVALSHPRIEPVSESALDKIKNLHKTAKARFTAMKEDWNALYAAECASDRARSAQVMNSNTYSATLVTAFLVDGFVTDLQNRWAMLKAFSMDFTVDAFKPLASAVLSHVTAGATTQTDATNFESGNSTVGAISATMHQYTQSFQVSNADLQSGLRMEKLVAINSANFANKVTEVATVPITTAIFTATPITRAAAAFDFTDLATLQGQLKKSPIKNLILDGSYIARIANTPGFFQTAGVVGGDTGAWKAFGWDLIAQLTDWTGAGANVQGFACNPQAIAGITGLPVQPPNVPGGILSQQVISVPELGVSILVSDWFNPSTRTSWRSFDIMAGFHEVDTTAGVVIQSQ